MANPVAGFCGQTLGLGPQLNGFGVFKSAILTCCRPGSMVSQRGELGRRLIPGKRLARSLPGSSICAPEMQVLSFLLWVGRELPLTACAHEAASRYQGVCAPVLSFRMMPSCNLWVMRSGGSAGTLKLVQFLLLLGPLQFGPQVSYRRRFGNGKVLESETEHEKSKADANECWVFNADDGCRSSILPVRAT
jgi:hypothetical protein